MFWFYGDLRCNVCYLFLFLLYICRTQIEGHFPHRGPISSQIEGRFIFPTSRVEIVTYAR